MEKEELLRDITHQGCWFLLDRLTDGFLTKQQRCRHQSMGLGWSWRAGDERDLQDLGKQQPSGQERRGLSLLGNYSKDARERARRIGRVLAQFGRWLYTHMHLGKPRAVGVVFSCFVQICMFCCCTAGDEMP